MVIHEGGRKCRCGRLGCFERYASATGLKLTTREYMGKYPESVLWDFCEGRDEDVSGNHPFEAAEKGDAAAQEIIKVFIKDLACGVVNLINLFQPEVLVIAGGVAGAGEALLAPLTEIVKKEIYTKELEDNNTKIVLSELGDKAAVIGSAVLKR
jgi:glucokinase